MFSVDATDTGKKDTGDDGTISRGGGKPHSTVLAAKIYDKKKSAQTQGGGNGSEPLESPRVIMRTKELADVGAIKRRLEKKAFPGDGTTKVEEIITRSLSPNSKSSKTKLKHLDRNVSHSKIISKMIELQKGEVDPGTLKLCEQAEAEHEYLNVYKSGDVDHKVKAFERQKTTHGKILICQTETLSTTFSKTSSDENVECVLQMWSPRGSYTIPPIILDLDKSQWSHFKVN